MKEFFFFFLKLSLEVLFFFCTTIIQTWRLIGTALVSLFYIVLANAVELDIETIVEATVYVGVLTSELQFQLFRSFVFN